jgi:outer membrane protein assembly factor BamB
MKAEDILVVAGRYTVSAFRKADGEELWQTTLITGFFKFSGPFVTLVVEKDSIYAYVAGELFCLELFSGKILWQRKQPDLGREVVSMAIPGGPASSQATAAGRLQLEKKQQDSSASDGGAS